MNKQLFFYLSLLVILASCQSDNVQVLPKEKSYTSNVNALFASLDSEQTNVHFTNQVEDQKDFNILNYRNFYNGGGVALGDIDNDGLVDIYFTANQGANKLYRNQGGFTFEDITDKAGVAGTKAWSTGVTMADVNADGWLDIYVCHSGDITGENKENELFINQQDGTFQEAAKAWNLNDAGYSTHASFFDYDSDGDLDCFILNNSFKSPDKIEMYRKKRTEIDRSGGDRLLRNDGTFFTDVTSEAGIYSSSLGFGLGVSVADVNGDILPDIYVSNDFWERDYFYRNIGNGKFVEELTARFAHTSMNSMGADIGDLDNNGLPDLMTTDMLPADNFRRKTKVTFEPYRLQQNKQAAGYHYQLMQNALHFNQGNGSFREVAYHSGVVATDWSWGTLFFDFDNDGWKDIFVSNGLAKDLTDLDFVDFIKDEEQVKKIVAENQRADFRDYLPYMPSVKVANYAFVNLQNNRFSNEASDLGLGQPSFSNGAAYGDLDNDGDLDLVVNNTSMPAFIYQNKSAEKGENNYLSIQFKGTSKNPFGIGATVRLTTANGTQIGQHFLARGFQSSVAPGLTFGLGTVQTVERIDIIWPDKQQQVLTNIDANQTITLEHTAADLKFKRPEKNRSTTIFTKKTLPSIAQAAFHKENKFDDFDTENLLLHQLSTLGPKILTADVNGDKLDDFLVLGAADDPSKLFIQNRNGAFDSPFQESIFFDQKLEATCGVFFDIDRDDDLDLLIGHGGNEFAKGRSNFGLRFYENDGAGQFKIELEKAPPGGGNLSCIEPTDLNKDGYTDFFMGGYCVPGNYGLIPASFLAVYDGNGGWVSNKSQEIGQLGMVTAAQWTDVDRDDDPDLLVVGEWMPITLLRMENGSIQQKETIPNSHGWWQSVKAVDLDGDGDDDYILGNWGENSVLKASVKNPMQMHVKDFDGNGKSEFIIETWFEGSQKAFPFATKMDLTKQLPNLRKRVLKYETYANSSYEVLFSEQERAGAKTFTVNTLKSAILWNEPSGLRLEALPNAAQLAPILAIHTDDFNQDGQLDLLLMGNYYGVKPEVGRQDANRGLVLIGDKQGIFTELSSDRTGIDVEGEVRDIAKLKKADGKELLLIGRNNAPVLSFEKN
ncbi:MAG: CRTAC1 family protein [Bacteroidota bacterium]